MRSSDAASLKHSSSRPLGGAELDELSSSDYFAVTDNLSLRARDASRHHEDLRAARTLAISRSVCYKNFRRAVKQHSTRAVNIPQ
jgi:hypothetical protein